MCNDFTKLRLLPDREDYKGPKRKPGVDPRPGLDGKYGKTFRQVIAIWGWILKYHPDCLFFIENVDFTDMAKDWKEVCDALGTPIIITSHDYIAIQSYAVLIGLTSPFPKILPMVMSPRTLTSV